ncbi:leucine-rich repeat and WD repeat-containing protein 1 isoform X2 [Thalassophryne amazonica]|uniref:leucine-rich repeat and WD repeat-containing protein 1 isoform X2 n=1 Tax=Thalassophryne amazonica TaxID=390379 RepID=UPI0014709BEA|nr:leucine-rich repeat and WD repeat-containing protein 1 isoform X2 [Thalassophryne amazonica]
MEKITEKLLLEKGSPKTTELEEIKTLNLSKLGLRLQDLPVRLLSRLRSLQRCNLSGNKLHEFPRNLNLPELRYLDLSDNQMEDVTTLGSLSSLEELKMEDNIYIVVSDNYKLMVLLPNLRIYNGKDIGTTANHLRYVYSENLKTRIIAVWEKSFSLPEKVTAENMVILEKKFVSAARQQVKYGPNSVSDFTKWRVEIMAKEYLRSLTGQMQETGSTGFMDKNENGNVPLSAKRKPTASPVDAGVSLTPRKKLRADLPASPADDGTQRSSCRRLTPHRQTQTVSPRLIPRKTVQCPSTTARGQSAGAKTPRKSSKAQKDLEDDDILKKDISSTELHRDGDVLPRIKSYNTIKPVCLKPLHVLQCHSKQDSCEDLSTQLWACAFQTLSDQSNGGGGGNHLVATCGGDSLCVIDCETGMVMKKYKIPGEEFFSLAWTTVLMFREGGASSQQCSVLAAGGKRGIVKLIHPRNNTAYGEFRASRKALAILRFSPCQGSFLFTGSYDNKIVMWDIGGVDSKYNYKVIQLVVFEATATPLHLCFPPSSPKTHLLAACEDGLHCYNTQPGANRTMKRSKVMEITFPLYEKEDKDHNYHTVDGLSFVTDDIVASKNYTQPSIYLWSWSRTKALRPNKNQTVSAVVLAELQWARTEVPYLALNTCPRYSYVVCGDDKGRLWTYQTGNLFQKGSYQSGKTIHPTEVLEWPSPIRKDLSQVEGPSINCVAMDPELHYLVALSDKNMVIVWKRVESS